MKVPNHIGIFFVYGVIKLPLGVHDLSPKTSCNLVVVALVHKLLAGLIINQKKLIYLLAFILKS